MENETKICKDCGQELSTTNFYHQNGRVLSYCKSCYSKRGKVTNKKWRDANPYLAVIKHRWSSLNQRTVNGKYTTSPSAVSCPQLKSYRDKGITLEMTYEEFKAFMLANETLHNEIVAKGEKSSIDRIDDNLGYSLDNIQMISLHSNICKRYGRELEYHNEDKKAKTKTQNKKQYRRRKK